MSVSLRRFRAIVALYSDTGTDGAVNSTYTKSPSTDPDGLWWCSRNAASGRENTVGMKADERIDEVIGFAAEVPVDRDALVSIDGVQFWVRSVLPRDYGRNEVQVLAERVSGRPITIVGA